MASDDRIHGVDANPDATFPQGELALQAFCLPRDTNANGDIFGGWLLSQMDLAGATIAGKEARGRVVTAAIDAMCFHRPVKVGHILTCYAEVAKRGRTSVHVHVEAWAGDYTHSESEKVTEGRFIFVAVDEDGNKRELPPRL